MDKSTTLILLAVAALAVVLFALRTPTINVSQTTTSAGPSTAGNPLAGVAGLIEGLI